METRVALTLRMVVGLTVPEIARAFLFFLQAEDGIRARYVTGVQTCALPISRGRNRSRAEGWRPADPAHRADQRPRHRFCHRRDERLHLGLGLRDHREGAARRRDRKSTRLNSSHVESSYAVF